MLPNITQSKSKTFLMLCCCFILGVAIASVYNQRIDFAIIYAIALSLIGFAVIFRKQKRALFTVYGLLFTLLGFSRYTFALPQSIDFSSHTQRFTAVVSSEPDVRQDGVRYQLRIQNEKYRTKNIKEVYTKIDLYPRYAYGDVLQVECRLREPTSIGSFRYDMYLRRFSVDALCSGPHIQKIGEGGGSAIMRSILSLKQSFAMRINSLWHEPYAGFMAGLLYGYRGGLGTLNEDFNRTGVTHIVAISGYNITILATILMAISSHLFIRRQYAFWMVTGAIILFVIFTGASGSVVRAGIMGFLVLLAQQLGRLKRMANVLALTAALMVLHNPFVLAWDVGFQLSFIATLGLVYLAPTIGKPFRYFPERFGLRESAVATVAAIIATLPLIMYQFGRVSLVAPIVNLLILWIIPWIMLIGVLTLALSIVTPLSVLFSWIAWIMMRYVTLIVDLFSALPFASIEIRTPASVVFFMYIIMIFFLHGRLSVFDKNG